MFFNLILLLFTSYTFLSVFLNFLFINIFMFFKLNVDLEFRIQ